MNPRKTIHKWNEPEKKHPSSGFSSTVTSTASSSPADFFFRAALFAWQCAWLQAAALRVPSGGCDHVLPHRAAGLPGIASAGVSGGGGPFVPVVGFLLVSQTYMVPPLEYSGFRSTMVGFLIVFF